MGRLPSNSEASLEVGVSMRIGQVIDTLQEARLKNLLMPPFLLMGCYPGDFREAKRPFRTKSGKRPIKVGKRPIEGKRPVKAIVLVGISATSWHFSGLLHGLFSGTPAMAENGASEKAHREVYDKFVAKGNGCRV